MGESIPSAAATARRSNYTQQPRMQSQHTVDSASARYQNDGQKPKLVKLAKEAFKPGMIIRAVVHEPSWERASHSSITVAERQITDTMYGPVISKVRKLIVVANYQDHYAAVPLYSHNGHGLSGKPKPEEFVSVQDHRQNEPFTQLSVHIPLITAHLNRDVNLYEPTTTAYIPYIHPRRYVFPVVHEGYLEPESTRRLLELVGMFLNFLNKFLSLISHPLRLAKIYVLSGFNMLT